MPHGAAPTLLVTRVQPQADQWVARLAALGVAAHAMPLLHIGPAADAAALATAWQGLDGCALAMFVSAAAVTHFFAARPAAWRWPPALLAGATGPGTAAALHEAGVPADCIVVPDAGADGQDSEHLWARLRPLRDWRGARALVVRGVGGRDWLAEALRGAGAAVDFVAAYQRCPPRWGAAEHAVLAQALAAPAAHCWLFSSSEAAGHLPQMAPAARWREARALATHPRIAAAVRRLGFGQVTEVAPTAQAVAAALAAPAAAAGGAPPGR